MKFSGKQYSKVVLISESGVIMIGLETHLDCILVCNLCVFYTAYCVTFGQILNQSVLQFPYL